MIVSTEGTLNNVGAPGLLTPSAKNQPNNLDFGDVTKQLLNSVNEQQNLSGQLIKQVEMGESDDLVGAMLASQQAGIAFDTLLAVRNKLMSAYQDVMKMPL